MTYLFVSSNTPKLEVLKTACLEHVKLVTLDTIDDAMLLYLQNELDTISPEHIGIVFEAKTVCKSELDMIGTLVNIYSEYVHRIHIISCYSMHNVNIAELKENGKITTSNTVIGRGKWKLTDKDGIDVDVSTIFFNSNISEYDVVLAPFLVIAFALVAIGAGFTASFFNVPILSDVFGSLPIFNVGVFIGETVKFAILVESGQATSNDYADYVFKTLTTITSFAPAYQSAVVSIMARTLARTRVIAAIGYGSATINLGVASADVFITMGSGEDLTLADFVGQFMAFKAFKSDMKDALKLYRLGQNTGPIDVLKNKVEKHFKEWARDSLTLKQISSQYGNYFMNELFDDVYSLATDLDSTIQVWADDIGPTARAHVMIELVDPIANDNIIESKENTIHTEEMDGVDIVPFSLQEAYPIDTYHHMGARTQRGVISSQNVVVLIDALDSVYIITSHNQSEDFDGKEIRWMNVANKTVAVFTMINDTVRYELPSQGWINISTWGYNIKNVVIYPYHAVVLSFPMFKNVSGNTIKGLLKYPHDYNVDITQRFIYKNTVDNINIQYSQWDLTKNIFPYFEESRYVHVSDISSFKVITLTLNDPSENLAIKFYKTLGCQCIDQNIVEVKALLAEQPPNPGIPGFQPFESYTIEGSTETCLKFKIHGGYAKDANGLYIPLPFTVSTLPQREQYIEVFAETKTPYSIGIEGIQLMPKTKVMLFEHPCYMGAEEVYENTSATQLSPYYNIGLPSIGSILIRPSDT